MPRAFRGRQDIRVQLFRWHTRAGRIQQDLSVAGTIQVRGNGPVRFVQLPPGTLKVKGGAVCASVARHSVRARFNVEPPDPQSFRGSVSGLSFAYCDFTRRLQRTPSVRTTAAAATAKARSRFRSTRRHPATDRQSRHSRSRAACRFPPPQKSRNGNPRRPVQVG
jgi:hypothetical protein